MWASIQLKTSYVLLSYNGETSTKDVYIHSRSGTLQKRIKKIKMRWWIIRVNVNFNVPCPASWAHLGTLTPHFCLALHYYSLLSMVLPLWHVSVVPHNPHNCFILCQYGSSLRPHVDGGCPRLSPSHTTFNFLGGCLMLLLPLGNLLQLHFQGSRRHCTIRGSTPAVQLCLPCFHTHYLTSL